MTRKTKLGIIEMSFKRYFQCCSLFLPAALEPPAPVVATRHWTMTPEGLKPVEMEERAAAGDGQPTFTKKPEIVSSGYVEG